MSTAYIHNPAEDFFNDAIPPHDPHRVASIDGFHDPDGPSNSHRAQSAADELRSPTSLKHDEDYSDLITNLLHLAHREGHDTQAIATAALRDFHQEAGPL